MKLHLPLFLRKSLLVCLSAVAACTVGSASAWAEPQNLTFGDSSLTWDAQGDSFVNEAGEAAAFAEGDNVSFTGESIVTLGQDITAGTLDIAAGADVTIDLGNYTLNADTISLSGTLNVGDSLSIASGSTLAVQNDAAVLDSALVLGEKSGLAVDADASLNNNTLTLQGGSNLILTAAGDGKTYTLLTGVSGLLDAQGNAITLDDTNNAISNYFDASQPGTGFWADGTLQLTNAGTLQLVLHNETVKEAITITSRQTNPSAYQYYAGIAFEDISFASSSDAYGGAIYGSTITLSDNGSVTFSGNTASSSYSDSTSCAYGGAIAGNTITLSNNGSVSFSGNAASGSYSYGGAICGSTIMLNNNGSVTFIGNTASSSSSSSSSSASGGAIEGPAITLSNNGSVTFIGNTVETASGYAYGGAVYGDVTMEGNGDVTFSGNAASGSYSYGGAIYGYGNSTITLSNNGSVSFSGNTASSSSSSSPSASGGAIEGSTITLSNNGSVTFNGNAVETASGYTRGGAICGDVTMEGNGDVAFSGNAASGSYSYGGAIYGYGYSTITLSNNGSVVFEGNTASSYGGAIDGDVTMAGNGDVAFNGNAVETASGHACGGAIYGSTIMLNNNGSVTFSRNTASGSSFAYGGAIYTFGNLSIQNNDSVSFYQNAEVKNGSYRLRSIYADGSADVISLSAAAEKYIEFRDSIYIASGSTFNLNETCGEIEQKGDIIFTGATTVNDLYKAKGNMAGTAEEIRLSRTTEVNTMTNLYGGRLRVEDGAVYQGQGITAHEASEAAVRVKDAELSHAGYNLEFNAGTALEVAGNSTIRGNVNLKEGSLFKLEQAASLSLHETVEADAATLTVNGGALLEGGASLNASLTLADGATLDMDALEAGAVTLNGALTFGGQVTMGDKLFGILSEMSGWEESVTLFTGLTDLVLPAVAADDAADRLWVGDVFSNLAGNENYYFNYVPEVGSLAVVHVPEPTTTTLGLLALSALAVRRRRK